MNPTLNSILTHQLGLTRFLTVRCVSFREVTSCSTPQRDKRTDRRSREDDLPGISVLPAADGSFLAVHRDWHGQPGQLARDTRRSRARPPPRVARDPGGGFLVLSASASPVVSARRYMLWFGGLSLIAGGHGRRGCGRPVWAGASFPDRAEFERRPSVVAGDCDEKRTHPSRREVERG